MSRESCARCGADRDPADPASLAWAHEPAVDGVRWLCPGCARRHARDIEARLPDDWWV